MGSSRRWWNFLVFAAGVVLALAGFRHQWRCSDLPPDFPAADLGYPVSVEGYQADGPERLRFIAESWPPGTTLMVTDAAGATRALTLVLRQGYAALVLTGLSGLVFLSVAMFFLAVRGGSPGAGSFFWVSFLYGLSIMVGGVFFPREHPLLVISIGVLQFVCLAALPVVFMRLALSFPRRSAVLDRWPWLVPAVAVGAAALVVWQSLVFHRYFAAPTMARAADLAPAMTVADLFMVVVTLAGVLVFAVRGRRLVLTRERDQVRWLLWGFTIGAAPYVFLRTVPELLGLNPLLPDEVDRVVELAIPVAFVGAVVRHRILDIDVIIRRSLLYGLLAAALLMVYLAVGVVFGRWYGGRPGLPGWLPPLLLGAGAGIAFVPLRRAVGGWIDRTFFKLAHDHDARLARLDRDLGAAADRAGVAAALGQCLEGALPARIFGIALRRGGDILIAGSVDADAVRAYLELEPDGPGAVVAVPQSTSLPEVETPAFPAGLRAAGVVLVQSLAAGKDQGGLVLLGQRRTERRYVQQDLDFLAGCARVASRHLERIALVRAVAEESLARERLAELDRLKSEFLARVAHDLRTPVAGIAWSARNLLDGIVGEMSPDQIDYLRTIAGSGDHLGRLVDNLLEVSQLDRAEIRLELAAVDAAGVWREAAVTVRPLAEAKAAVIEVDAAPDLSAIRAHRDKLIEVAVNLLDNAVKYTAAGSVVTVSLGPPDRGFLPVAVRDRGPGLRGQTPAGLFRRFAQGEPSPHSSRKGFGLGLHIAATYLELMGGSLDAEDHADGGAVFTCRLPLVAAPDRSPNRGDDHEGIDPDR